MRPDADHRSIAMSLVGTPFLLSEQLIESISFDELFARIRARYQPEIEAYAIELGEEQNLSIG